MVDVREWVGDSEGGKRWMNVYVLLLGFVYRWVMWYGDLSVYGF